MLRINARLHVIIRKINFNRLSWEPSNLQWRLLCSIPDVEDFYRVRKIRNMELAKEIQGLHSKHTQDSICGPQYARWLDQRRVHCGCVKIPRGLDDGVCERNVEVDSLENILIDVFENSQQRRSLDLCWVKGVRHKQLGKHFVKLKERKSNSRQTK